MGEKDDAGPAGSLQRCAAHSAPLCSSCLECNNVSLLHLLLLVFPRLAAAAVKPLLYPAPQSFHLGEERNRIVSSGVGPTLDSSWQPFGPVPTRNCACKPPTHNRRYSRRYRDAARSHSYRYQQLTKHTGYTQSPLGGPHVRPSVQLAGMHTQTCALVKRSDSRYSCSARDGCCMTQHCSQPKKTQQKIFRSRGCRCASCAALCCAAQLAAYALRAR